MQTECPKGENWQCQCNFRRLDIVEGKPPTLAVNVDCSGMQLPELPEKLPRNTIALNVSYNNVRINIFSNSKNFIEPIIFLKNQHNEKSQPLKKGRIYNEFI